MKILIYVAFFLLGLIIGISYNKNIENPVIKEYDTIAYIIEKDSIKYNIIVIDSIIYNLKQQMKHDIEQSKNINDSDAVKLFYKLTSAE